MNRAGAPESGVGRKRAGVAERPEGVGKVGLGLALDSTERQCLQLSPHLAPPISLRTRARAHLPCPRLNQRNYPKSLRACC